MTFHVFTEALHRLVNDEPLGAFCDWFAAAMLAEQEARAPVAPSGRAACCACNAMWPFSCGG